jgi:hypothetical protein
MLACKIQNQGNAVEMAILIGKESVETGERK